jgi:DNA repair exonuclease SbcCD nuclease subunit
MFRFVHAADIHLDSPLVGLERYEGAPIEAARQATRRALENLVSLCVQREVAFLLIAGDLYDGDWKEFGTGLYFVAQMARLREAGIPVVLVAGNHDAANKMTRRLPLPDNVHMLSADRPETVRLEQFQVAIHGRSFPKQAVTENLVAEYPAAVPGQFNVGLLHTALGGCDGHEPYAPCTLEDLRSRHYDYWALGHVHREAVLCEDPMVVFCGNLQGRHARETGPKGCKLVTVDRGRIELEHCPLDVLRWEHCRIDAGSALTGEDLQEQVRAALDALAMRSEDRRLAVRMTIEGRSAIHRRLMAEPVTWTNRIRALASDVGVGQIWVEKILLATAPPLAAGPAAEGPLAELLAWIGSRQSGPEDVASLADAVADLLEKLPPELREGPESLGVGRPERLRALAQQAEQLLAHRLLYRDASPT